MDKSLKIAKLNIKDMTKRIFIFYCIFISYLMLITRATDKDTAPLYGMDVFAFVFMIFCGIYTFKKKFYIAQSNNVSRKTFIKGIIISIFPLAGFMAIFEVLINRGLNAFIKAPTTYDNFFGNFRNLRDLGTSAVWIQDNSFITIVNTILLLFAMYCVAYIIGLVANMIYYRCNEIVGLAIIAMPAIFFKILKWMDVKPFVFRLYDINEYMKGIFNLSSNNIIPVIVIYMLIFVALYGMANLLARRVVIKEN